MLICSFLAASWHHYFGQNVYCNKLWLWHKMCAKFTILLKPNIVHINTIKSQISLGFCEVQLFQLEVEYYLNTYIIGHYKPSVRIMTYLPTPLTFYVLFLYSSDGTYSSKLIPNERLFNKLFMAILFHSQSFCQKSSKGKSPKKYCVFLRDVWPEICTVFSCRISHHTTY